jgi:hypothetical protein
LCPAGLDHFIFTYNGTNWLEQQKLVPSNGYSRGFFGNSVDISGSKIIIGSPFSVNDQSVRAGAAYIFLKNGNVWTQQSKLVLSDGFDLDLFGNSVALSGSGFIVGSPSSDVGENLNLGAAYFFISPPFGPDLNAVDDSGISTIDNITNVRALTFDVGGFISGATIELLRNGIVVDSVVGLGSSVTLRDLNAPADGVFRYTSRQIISGETSSQSEILYVTIDTTSPQIAVEQFASSPDPTTTDSVSFTYVLSESAFGLLSSDVSFEGSTANLSNASVQLTSFSGTNYIQVTNIVSNGQTITASVPASSFTDSAGNNNLASVSVDNTITVDNVRPDVSIDQMVGQLDPTAVQPIKYRVVFSEPITGFGANDIGFNGSTTNTFGAIVSISGSGLVYDVSVSGITSNGQIVRATVITNGVSDMFGNLNNFSTSTDNSVTLDNVAPSVTINQAPGQGDPTSNQPINYRVSFSEPVTGFDQSDIVLTNSSANVSFASIVATGSGSIYNVAINNVSSSGTVRPTIVASAAQDALANQSSASTSSDNSVTFSLRRKYSDFDGDGKTDISVFRPSVGEWYYQRSSNSVVNGATFGSSTDKIVPADYSGDGKTDIAIYRPSSGQWFVLRSEDFSFYAFPFGISTDIPAPGDYDGDGKADAAVFRPSTGIWYVAKSSGGVTNQPFGTNGDRPVVADYDGDGKSDIAIFRPSVGEWYYLRSSDSQVRGAQFGALTDKTVQGDYTGDGKADFAFFRPSTGFWYVLRSEDFSFFASPFGAATDIPTPGDYDGDGKFDQAVFRPSTGIWYINKSNGSGVIIQAFGASTDLPVPSYYLQ